MVVVVLNYSRSGGTLISSVLAQLDDIILVSEVNPSANASGSIAEQVKSWYGIDLKATSFVDSVVELDSYCKKNNKTLVIRDFSFVDFTPHRLNEFNPSTNFSSIEQLKPLVNLTVVGFVRDAFDIWISRNCPPKFSSHYLTFVQKIEELNCSIFKYEDFCNAPDVELQKICSTISLPFKSTALENPSNYQKVTGDNQLKKSSRGRKSNTITPLKRKQIPPRLMKMAINDGQMAEANRILGYPLDFNEKEMEHTEPIWLNWAKWHINKILYPTHFHVY